MDKLNTEQRAPAADHWRPDNLAGYKVGDAVRLPGIDATLEVIALNPPALLTLKAPSGRQLQAGWRAVSRAATNRRAAS